MDIQDDLQTCNETALPTWLDWWRALWILSCSQLHVFSGWTVFVSDRTSWTIGSLKSEPIWELQLVRSSSWSCALQQRRQGNLHWGFEVYRGERFEVFNGTLMKTVVVFHCLRGRTLTSSSWPSSLENPGAILKNIPAHVTDVTTDSQTLGFSWGACL